MLEHSPGQSTDHDNRELAFEACDFEISMCAEASRIRAWHAG